MVSKGRRDQPEHPQAQLQQVETWSKTDSDGIGRFHFGYNEAQLCKSCL